ncbi:MAG: hypothetical protein G01um1014106_225 [Parcubacteria group bacterium Gr01-1014_106]|nr:MAG: hypothetical protein G01um1014106_225 [Parcubacteria group bacterium Gr01-1014_106]
MDSTEQPGRSQGADDQEPEAKMETGPAKKRANQLDTVLTEYRTIRDEIVRTEDRQIRIVSVYIVAVGAAYAFMAGREKNHWDLLPFLGIFTAGFLWLYVAQGRLVTLLSSYMLEVLEGKKIPALAGKIRASAGISLTPAEKQPIGWQHFYRNHHSYSRLNTLRVLWGATLFVGLGMLPPCGYCLAVLKHFLCTSVSSLNDTIWSGLGASWSVIAMAVILGIMGFACYSAIELGRNPEKKAVEGRE